MKTRLALFAGALFLAAPAFAATDTTPPNYGNSSGPAVPSNAPGATDQTGTGPDASLGVTHARSSGPTRNGATLHGDAAVVPEGYGTITGPGADRTAPGADDGTGTGPDVSTGITHVHSSGSSDAEGSQASPAAGR